MSYLRPSLQASNPQLAQQPLPPPPPQEPRLPVEPLLDTRMAPGREIHLLELPCVEDKIKEQDQCCRIYNRSFNPPDHSPYLRNLGCSGTATGSGWLQLQRLIHRLSVTFSHHLPPVPPQALRTRTSLQPSNPIHLCSALERSTLTQIGPTQQPHSHQRVPCTQIQTAAEQESIVPLGSVFRPARITLLLTVN